MRIGIIGVGIITTNILEGFLSFGKCDHQFFLSPRNKERSKMLQSKYPENVTRCESNQQVLDNSELVFLGLLPDKAEGIIKELKFQRTHKVIGLIPIIGLPKLREIIGETEILCDVVPLPFISKRMGPIVCYPPNSEIIELLSPLGQVVAVNSEKEISMLRTVTSLMSPYYELIYTVVSWCVENGLNEEAAKAYVTSFFGGLSKMAAAAPCGGLDELAHEMTPGGINYQSLNYLMDKDAFAPWRDTLTPVLDRVRKTGKQEETEQKK